MLTVDGIISQEIKKLPENERGSVSIERCIEIARTAAIRYAEEAKKEVTQAQESENHNAAAKFSQDFLWSVNCQVPELPMQGFHGSMSRAGDCWDNSVVESFFGSLKQERVHWENYQSRYAAQQDILDYFVMFYNSTRLYSTLDYRSPNDYEQQIDLNLAA